MQKRNSLNNSAASRRSFLHRSISGILFFNLNLGYAQDCDNDTVESLDQQCFLLLYDAAEIAKKATADETASFQKWKDALISALKAVKGVADIVINCVVAKNPVKCNLAIVKAPKTLEHIVLTIDSVVTAIKLYERSKFVHKTAFRAFKENNGEDIINKLSMCGRSECLNAKQTIEIFVDEAVARIDRNIKKLREFESALRETKDKLAECISDIDKCKDLEEIVVPELEPPPGGAEIPDIPLP